MFVIFGAGAAFLVALLLTRLFLRPESRMHILDHPNERSLHFRPTPRTGGVAIVCGVVVGGVVGALIGGHPIPRAALWLGGLAVLMTSVSYWDDRRHLPVGFRLAVHFLVAVLLATAGVRLDTAVLPGASYALPAWLAGGASVLFAVWMINLYNFMDGMDGFAGGMAVIGFSTLALLGWWAGDQLFATLNLIIAGAAAGFLIYNFPPAQIFMGDTGSSTLGFLAAGMALWADSREVAPLWISVLVFSPFIVDATVTLMQRLVRREKIWQAHKNHYYQRLVQAGWGHRKTVLFEYCVMLLCAVAAMIAQVASVPAQWGIVVSIAILHVGFIGTVRVVTKHVIKAN